MKSSSTVFQVPVRPAQQPELGLKPGTTKSPQNWFYLDHTWVSDSRSGIRKLFLLLSLILIMDRFGNAHEFISMVTRVNIRILYILVPPVLIGFLITGGFRRFYSHKIQYLWTIFIVFMGLSVPFSAWFGGSLAALLGFLKTSLPIVLALGGMIVTWKECRWLIHAMSFGGFIAVGAARMLKTSTEERFMVEGQTSISDANDLSAHLLLLLPGMLYLVLSTKSSILIRLLSFFGAALSLYTVFSSGSRGALLGMIMMGILAVIKAPAWSKGLIVLTGFLGLVVLIALAPATALNRMTSILRSNDNSIEVAEAEASKAIRQEMLGRGLRHAITNPLVGVGLGQFQDYDSSVSASAGKKKVWKAAHNSYLEVAAEIGLLGFGAMISALVLSFRLLSQTHRNVKQMRGTEDMSLMLVCTMMSLTGFSITATFLNFGFSYYFPCLCGLAVVVTTAIRNEIAYEHKVASEAAARQAKKPVLPMAGLRPRWS